MADANRLSDAILQEIGHLELNIIEESEEELIEKDIEDIPPSLLRYLESSESRAAACQRLFLDKSAGVGGDLNKCIESEEHVSVGLESPLDESTLRKSSEGKMEDQECVEMNSGNQMRQMDKKEGIHQMVITKAENGEGESRQVKEERIQTGLHEEPRPGDAVTRTSSLPESPHRGSTNGSHQAAPPGLCQTDLPVASSAELTQDWLPEHTELKRLSWMKECISWTKLSLHNKRKRGPSSQRPRGPQRAAEGTGLPPLPPQSLLRCAGVKSLTQVTSVTLEALPGCSLSTLALCSQLQLLSLRRCRLRSLDGIGQLHKLCYVDVQENDISFVDCNNMKSLRILQLSHNRLTSIHGLAGAENLDVLDLSYNSITRISGLESLKSLQKLSLDHNELISTTGLSHMYTLLHLSCSHNHLTSVEGLENNALLHTLDLRANSLAAPPRLPNQVLLRELHLDDNSISSLQGLSACWLPLMQHLSVAQNRITELPTMADYVSLEKLDLQFNCISELQNVCEGLEGCLSLREVHLTGNPLQQESGWRSSLLQAVPGLQAVDEQAAGDALGSSAVRRSRLSPGSFLSLCQAHLQEASELQQQHSRELRQALSSLQAAKLSCRHLHEASQLATRQRFAHEYDDAETEKHWGRNRVNYSTFDQNSAESCVQDRLQPALSLGYGGGAQAALKKGETIPTNADIPPVTNHQDQALRRSVAAVVIQQRWREYRQKCGTARNLSTCDSSDQEAKTKATSATQGQAATVIQAFWRGFCVRRRLKATQAAVPVSDLDEDDFFEEDVFEELDAFFLKQWEVLSGDDVHTRHHPVPQQQKSIHEPSRSSRAPLSWRPRDGWADAQQVEPDGRNVSPVGFSRNESPTSDADSLSKTSEEIMEEWGFRHSGTARLMLQRAQKMKSKKLQKKKDPCVPFANCKFQMMQNGKTQHSRNHGRVGKAELGLQQAAGKERAQRWLDAHALHWGSDSEQLLPEIQAESGNGGRAQLSADQANTERPRQACGLSWSSSSAVRPQKQNSHPPRISLCHARPTVPSPKEVTLAPSKQERTSFRDKRVQLSGGWGGGRKKTK